MGCSTLGGGVHDIIGDKCRTFMVRVAHRLVPPANRVMRLYFK